MKKETGTQFALLIDRLRETSGLKDAEIANFAGVSAATVSRWGTGRKSPHPKAHLLVSDLTYFVMRLREYYGSEEIPTWLNAQHLQPQDERALDRICDGRAGDILAILDRLNADPFLSGNHPALLD